jgi:glycosyltransferase involved in cell wall biosynthesis
MLTPIVSVVMSVFNGERYLDEAIESILSQSFSDFEFIAIDDGSTDGSGTLLEFYQKKDSRLRVYHQDNRGLVESLNRGCGLAQGEYLARMDADDIAVPDRLSWQVSFLQQNPEIAVLGGAIERIDSSGKSLEVKHYPVTDREIKAALLHTSALPHPAVLIRKETFRCVGGYRAAFVDAEDYDLWLRISERWQLANLDRVLLKYRVHAGQVSRLKLRQQALSFLAARALASAKREGRADLPNWVGGITPPTLSHLGVGESEQQTFVAASYLFWIKCLARWGWDAEALKLAADVYRTGKTDCIERWVIADTQLAMAGIYWRQKKFLKGLRAAGCALIRWPVILGRPLKRMLERLWKAYSNRRTLTPGASSSTANQRTACENAGKTL